MRRNLTGLAVVLIVLAAGVAYAAASSSSKPTPRLAFFSDVAKRLGVSTAKLQAALKGAYDDELNAAVAGGRLTSAQASAIKQRLAHSGRLGVGPALAFPMTAPVTPMGATVTGAMHSLPGRWSKGVCHVRVTPAPSGTSTITTSPSTSTSTSTASTTTTTSPGSPTSSTTRVVTPGGSATIVTHGGAGAIVMRRGWFGVWHSGRGMLACGVPGVRLRLGIGFAAGFGAVSGGFRAASTYLGLTPAKLISELQSGRSLSQIASAQGKTLAGLRSALERKLTQRLNRLVAAGVLTKAQAQQMLARGSALEHAILSGKASAKLARALRGGSGKRAHAISVAPWMAGATPGP